MGSDSVQFVGRGPAHRKDAAMHLTSTLISIIRNAGEATAHGDQPERPNSEIDRLRSQLDDARAEMETLRRELAAQRRIACAERYTAHHDDLTGLLNRRAFRKVGASMLDQLPVGLLACALVDLDLFKEINDSFGHETGDEVLIKAGRRLARYAGDNDVVARLGGDEYALLSASPTADPRWAAKAAAALADLFTAPMIVAGRYELNITASIGFVVAEKPMDIGELLRRADLAMYQAKRTRTETATTSAWFGQPSNRGAETNTSLPPDHGSEPRTPRPPFVPRRRSRPPQNHPTDAAASHLVIGGR